MLTTIAAMLKKEGVVVSRQGVRGFLVQVNKVGLGRKAGSSRPKKHSAAVKAIAYRHATKRHSSVVPASPQHCSGISLASISKTRGIATAVIFNTMTIIFRHTVWVYSNSLLLSLNMKEYKRRK